MANWFWNKFFEIKMNFISVKCFFVGHDERTGYAENYEDDYCDRCWKSWPQDRVTFPEIKENVYYKMIDLKEKFSRR